MNRSAAPTLLVWVGPTASGKTDLALELGEAVGGEILAVDSVQVYRALDIGSGKATPAQQARVRHHGLDLVDPDQPFDAAAYVRHAEEAIREITARGRRVLLTVGTGLYLRALLHGLLPVPAADPALKARLLEELGQSSPAAMHRRLREVDPELACRLAPRDVPRILRGLEVFEITGIPLSVHQERHRFQEQRYPALTFGLRWPREVLRERIATRCRLMVEQGLPEEVRRLRERGYGPQLRALQTLGYLQWNRVLDGECTPATALEEQIRQTWHYARRQLTWFGADPTVRWLDCPWDPGRVLAVVREALGW